MNWITLKDELPPIDDRLIYYAVEDINGVQDMALYGSSGMMNEPSSFFEPKNKRFKAVDIVKWSEF